MGLWSTHVVPRVVDLALGRPEIRALRAEVCAGLTGRVLELGAGSGPNLPLLPADVAALDVVEPSDVAWARSAARRAEASVPVTRIGLDGQRIAAPDAAYDVVLCTFALCTIPDPAAALGEAVRLLRPGGRLHLLEHGAHPDARIARWQARLDPWQQRLVDGCHLTREPFDLVRAAGLRVVEEHARDLGPGPGRVVGHLRWGLAAR